MNPGLSDAELPQSNPGRKRLQKRGSQGSPQAEPPPPPPMAVVSGGAAVAAAEVQWPFQGQGPAPPGPGVHGRGFGERPAPGSVWGSGGEVLGGFGAHLPDVGLWAPCYEKMWWLLKLLVRPLKATCLDAAMGCGIMG